MKTWSKTKQRGFTLIELGMVIVILGILAAMIVPKYIDLSSDALTASKLAMEGTVKSAYSITIMDKGNNPTLSELATNVQGGVANVSGIEVSIDGTSYIVRTYENIACTDITDVNTDTVKCIGSIA